MTDGCDELLERARVAYWSARQHHRDGMLEAGRLLHEFVLGCLRQGDAVSEERRQKDGLTRRAAVRKAAAHLKATPDDVTKMIATAMTVELLSDGGKVGTLSWSTIVLFWRFVRRRTGKRGVPNAPGRNGVPASSSETWGLCPGFGDRPVKLFRAAADAGMTYEEVRPAVLRLFATAKVPRRSRRVSRKEEAVRQTMRAVAAVASPGDLADSLFEMVKDAEDPVAVAEKLLARARVWAKERRDAQCRDLYEAG